VPQYQHPLTGHRLVAEGFQYHLRGQEFDPSYPFTYCRLCGDVYQTAQSRNYDPNDIVESALDRRAWSYKHISTKHTQRELDALENSGLYMTPEAQYKLAPLGVVSLSDFKISEEHHQAGKDAPRYREDLV